MGRRELLSRAAVAGTSLVRGNRHALHHTDPSAPPAEVELALSPRPPNLQSQSRCVPRPSTLVVPRRFYRPLKWRPHTVRPANEGHKKRVIRGVSNAS